MRAGTASGRRPSTWVPDELETDMSNPTNTFDRDQNSDAHRASPALASVRSSPLLRWAFLADAAASGASGLLMVLGAGLLGGRLGLPETLLSYAGLSLLPFAALLVYLARRTMLPRAAVVAIVIYNALRVIDSVVLLLSGWAEPTALGYAFVGAQALVVAVLAELQYVGLRNSIAVG